MLEFTPLAVPDNIIDFWESFYGFVARWVSFGFFLGALSRSMVVAAWGGYLVFVYIAINVGDSLLDGILIVSLVLIFVGMAFKVWRSEATGEI